MDSEETFLIRILQPGRTRFKDKRILVVDRDFVWENDFYPLLSEGGNSDPFIETESFKTGRIIQGKEEWFSICWSETAMVNGTMSNMAALLFMRDLLQSKAFSKATAFYGTLFIFRCLLNTKDDTVQYVDIDICMRQFVDLYHSIH